jgi:shikimate dehydrogenase
VAGANVTIPYKQAVISMLDTIDPEAGKVQAVNTIVARGSALEGFNTDVVALRGAIAKLGEVPGPVVVLGGGGAARAGAAAVAPATVTFVVRTPRPGLPGPMADWDSPEWYTLVREAGLLVNATPLGRRGELPLPADDLPRRGAVVDLVYARGGTPLTLAAQERGLATVDGWEILLRQGAAAFRLWTGRAAPEDAMRRAIADCAF